MMEGLWCRGVHVMQWTCMHTMHQRENITMPDSITWHLRRVPGACWLHWNQAIYQQLGHSSVKSAPIYKLSVATVHHIVSTAAVIAIYNSRSRLINKSLSLTYFGFLWPWPSTSRPPRVLICSEVSLLVFKILCLQNCQRTKQIDERTNVTLNILPVPVQTGRSIKGRKITDLTHKVVSSSRSFDKLWRHVLNCPTEWKCSICLHMNDTEALTL